MTKRQRIAISSPCARATDALQSEFYRAIRVGSLGLSSILTVNK